MATGFAPVLEPEKKAQQPTTGPLTPINEIQARLLNYVQDIPDPRVSRTQKHLLTDILVIAIGCRDRRGARLGRHGKLWHQ